MKAQWISMTATFEKYEGSGIFLGQVARESRLGGFLWVAHVALKHPVDGFTNDTKHFDNLQDAKTHVEKTVREIIEKLASAIDATLIPAKAHFAAAIPDCIDVVDTIGGGYSPWVFGHEESDAIDSDVIDNIWHDWLPGAKAKGLIETDLFDAFMVHLGNLGYTFVPVGGGMLSIGSFSEGDYHIDEEELESALDGNDVLLVDDGDTSNSE
jgi:hypothetical protein